MSDKPVIFISHSSKDRELVRLLKEQIELCFDNTVEAFAADIEPGENWFDTVMSKLNSAEAIVVLITPNSVEESHWVWFELGYFWARHDDALTRLVEKQKIYYPLATNEIDIPRPVRDLQIQIARINDADQVGRFFVKLCNQFQKGDSGRIDFAVFGDKQPKPISQTPRTVAAEIVENPYEGYSDEELSEILDDYFSDCAKEYDAALYETIDSDEPYSLDRDYIFTGALITYRKLDSTLGLPTGTSKRLLKNVALSYGLVPKPNSDHENTIRFKPKEQADVDTNEINLPIDNDIPF